MRPIRVAFKKRLENDVIPVKMRVHFIGRAVLPRRRDSGCGAPQPYHKSGCAVMQPCRF
jgi:hypothetical protein